MKRISILLLLVVGLMAISSCSSDNELTYWDVETMTMSDGEEVSIANMMVFTTSYEPRFNETVCTLSKSRGLDWIETYFVWRDDKLFESKYSPYKYLNKKDPVTNKITKTKNVMWQEKIISVDKEPTYSVVNLGNGWIKLVLIGGDVSYTFKNAGSTINL